jgi:hypothetical protein
VSHPAAGDLRPDLAFAEDRAAALGRTGRALQAAVTAYRRALAAGEPDEVLEVRLDEAAGWAYRLVLQRECAGARGGNLEAVVAAYDLPGEVVRRLGRL